MYVLILWQIAVNIAASRMSFTGSWKACRLDLGSTYSPGNLGKDGINGAISAITSIERKEAQMNENRLLKPMEAAEVLGVALTTLYGWTSARKIPFRKAGRLLRFDRAELENWTRKGTYASQKTLD